MNIEKGMRCRQIKPVNLGSITFDYPDRRFMVQSCDDEVVTCQDGFLVFGIDREQFENYFEIEQPKLVQEQDYRIIINNPAVVVILADGTKGVAKCMPEDRFDVDRGFNIAYRRAKIKSMEKELKKLTK